MIKSICWATAGGRSVSFSSGLATSAMFFEHRRDSYSWQDYCWSSEMHRSRRRLFDISGAMETRSRWWSRSLEQEDTGRK